MPHVLLLQHKIVYYLL